MKHLNEWIRLVNAQGNEVGVTLLVGGTIVSGTLTPWTRYHAWMQEVMMRTGLEGSPHALPDIAMGPISPTMSDRARSEFAALAKQEDAAPEEYAPAYSQFALRDVEVRAGLPAAWQRMPYLVVNAAAVGAFFPASQEIRASITAG